MKVNNSDIPLNGLPAGDACLLFLANQYKKGKNDRFRQIIATGEKRVSLTELGKVGEKLGFRTRVCILTHAQLKLMRNEPCILDIGQHRFIVLLARSKWGKRGWIRYYDPASGYVTGPEDISLARWTGEALFFEPTFRLKEKAESRKGRLNWALILQYLRLSRWQVAQVLMTLVITSFMQLIFPYLMQSIVDEGINTKDISFISIVLIAQLTLVVSRTFVDFIRNYLLLFISSTVNLSILADFWMKLTGLPMAHLSRYSTGDLLQRINDNKLIQNFLTGPAIHTLFASFNFIVFAFVLVNYKAYLFGVFVLGVVLYGLWMKFFMGIRRKINYQVFHASTVENNSTLELVQGMQEIKLQDLAQSKRWKWENAQTAIFRFNFKGLTCDQLQQGGVVLIYQVTDIVLTFMVARLVIRGELTFGAMLAVQYIIGQLSGPVEQIIEFIRVAQDAKISMERLNEIHALEDEENPKVKYKYHLPRNGDLNLSGITFSYPGSPSIPALTDIQLEIPEGKTTAIVGVSGSGKTTLIKLLLRFYETYNGQITVGGMDLKEINPTYWRRQCAAVLQDSYIFEGTVAENIVMEMEKADQGRLIEACRKANILSFIDSLPDGFNTSIGVGGVGISTGQRQRLLIARAVYKAPRYLFFDESTNALDANTETAILENLEPFFKERTVVVVAHRLNTVCNADKIIVLERGGIVETGNHQELSRLKGRYYELVKNQLELGN
jgi:ATP-binding cassette subfamily B protein